MSHTSQCPLTSPYSTPYMYTVQHIIICSLQSGRRKKRVTKKAVTDRNTDRYNTRRHRVTNEARATRADTSQALVSVKKRGRPFKKLKPCELGDLFLNDELDQEGKRKRDRCVYQLNQFLHIYASPVPCSTCISEAILLLFYSVLLLELLKCFPNK